MRLGGDPDHPVTQGFLCYRTSQFPATAERPGPAHDAAPADERPASSRSRGTRRSASIADRLLAIRAESGPAAILHYRSGGSLGLLKSVVDYFWELFGPVTVKRGDICSGAGDAAQETDFGDEESHDLFDLLNAKNILLWGKNPHVSNVHLLPVLREAKRRGARIAPHRPGPPQDGDARRPRRSSPRPGGDFDLAMGVAARLFETGRDGSRRRRRTATTSTSSARSPSRAPPADWAAAADVGLEDVERARRRRSRSGPARSRSAGAWAGG